MSEGITKSQISEAIFGWGLRNDDGHNLSMDDTDEIAEYIMKQAAQAQAGDGEAVGVIDYAFMAGVALTEKGASLPHGTKLYTAPPAAVNQQLLEALEATLQTVEDYTILIHEEWGDGRTLEQIEADGELHKSVFMARSAIAAAQEQK